MAHRLLPDRREAPLAQPDSSVGIEITVFGAFTEARGIWERFEAESECYAFQCYAWLKAWYDTVGSQSGIEPCIVLVRRSGGAVAMLLPLGIEKHAGTSCLTWLGGVLSDYHAPMLSRTAAADIASDADRFRRIWNAIRKTLPHHDFVRFEKQPEYVGTLKNPFLLLGGVPHPSSAHSVRLEGNFGDFLAKTHSSKTLSTERRKRRKLERRGTLTFVVADGPAEAEQLLSVMFRQKSAGYRELGVVDLFANDRYRSFLERLSTLHPGRGLVHLCALKLDDRVIATHWGLIHDKRLYYLLPTYERGELMRYSPGNILLHFLLEWCFENGLTVCDFTTGDEPYKLRWRDAELRLFDFTRCYTVAGYGHVLPLRVKRGIKYKVKQSPKILKTLQSLRSRIARSRRALASTGKDG